MSMTKLQQKLSVASLARAHTPVLIVATPTTNRYKKQKELKAKSGLRSASTKENIEKQRADSQAHMCSICRQVP